MHIKPYSAEYSGRWNDLVVSGSKNGTFLFHRDYMEYHKDRFRDASLMIFENDELIGVFPASAHGQQVVSHAGLTYGGLIVDKKLPSVRFLGAFSALLEHLATKFTTLDYKLVPSVYHELPCDEEKYALFLAGARLVRRDLSSVIIPAKRLPLRKGRKSDLSKGLRNGLKAVETNDLEQYWQILAVNLESKHGKRPVHTVEEMRLLQSRFPSQIRLFGVYNGPDMLAGALVFETSGVAHTQYIGCSEAGRPLGALDVLISHLLDSIYAGKQYFSFGISTTEGGTALNTGLLEFKESFGARAVVHDIYSLDLQSPELARLATIRL